MDAHKACSRRCHFWVAQFCVSMYILREWEREMAAAWTQCTYVWMSIAAVCFSWKPNDYNSLSGYNSNKRFLFQALEEQANAFALRLLLCGCQFQVLSLLNVNGEKIIVQVHQEEQSGKFCSIEGEPPYLKLIFCLKPKINLITGYARFGTDRWERKNRQLVQFSRRK